MRRNRTRLLAVGTWVFLATAVGLAAEHYEVTLERGVAAAASYEARKYRQEALPARHLPAPPP